MRRAILPAFLFAVLSSPAQEAPPAFQWRPAAPIETPRYDHCAVSLIDGRVLVAGGMSKEGALKTVEIYGPDDAFRPGPPMAAARSGHTCTALPDGRVLVAGGAREGSAEVFDPSSGEWTSVDGEILTRRGHTATLLPGGRVLLAGGLAGEEPTGVLEIYQPETNRITRSAALLMQPRVRHASVALSDGRVLLTGGVSGGRSLTATELYNPATDTVAQAALMNLPRAGHAAVMLVDGRVLIVGGSDGFDDLGNGELYHERENRFEWVSAPMKTGRRDAVVTVIPGRGLVLIAGGESYGQAVAAAEVFEPWTNKFIAIGSLTAPRTRLSVAPLDDGTILATGGQNADGPSGACGVLSSPSLQFLSPEYTTGQTATVRGTRFPSSQRVNFSLRLADGTSVNNRLLTTGASINSAGGFASNIMQIQSGDPGKRFILRATAAPNDGTSNTITFGEVAAISEASFEAKIATTLSVEPIPASSVAGVTIPLRIRVNAVEFGGPLNGQVVVQIGGVTRSLFVLGNAPGSLINLSFCCVATPGIYPIQVAYRNDPKFATVSQVTAEAHTVVSRQVSISISLPSRLAALPLFTLVNVPVRVAVPAILAPAPAGTVTISRPGTAAQTAGLAPLNILFGSVASEASFPVQATFVDKPSACFSVQYSGPQAVRLQDFSYPPASANLCLPVGPATTTLQMTVPSSTYTFGTPYPVSLKLTFPPDLGVLNRNVTLSPLGVPITLNLAVGEASATAQLTMPFNIETLEANYLGGGDLGPSSVKVGVTMAPIATQTSLNPIPSPTANPVTLRATVSSTVPLPGSLLPQGTVQFFDGDLFIGQAPILIPLASPGAASVPQATLSNVSRPVGTRSFRAVYQGSSLFAGSSSQVRQVTIQ